MSTIVPHARHVDHTEHDIKCIVTEHGYARNTEVRSARRRAEGAEEQPSPALTERTASFWREYDAACRAFPAGE